MGCATSQLHRVTVLYTHKILASGLKLIDELEIALARGTNALNVYLSGLINNL